MRIQYSMKPQDAFSIKYILCNSCSKALLFQVDVIESQWNVLQTHIQESHDFTELVDFHQE